MFLFSLTRWLLLQISYLGYYDNNEIGAYNVSLNSSVTNSHIVSIVPLYFRKV